MKHDETEKQEGVQSPTIADMESALREGDLPKSQASSPSTTLERLKALPGILRTVGSMILLAAAATFLLQRWGAIDHVLRYFAFLGLTVTLAAAGFFCGLRIREDKGARTFLAVTAAIIPVHFCQLGALLYSCLAEVKDISPLLHWVAPSSLVAVGATAAGVLVLIPVTLLAFGALARTHAIRLTVAFLGANAVLLVPTRDPLLIGTLAVSLLLLEGRFERALVARDSSLRTSEGRLVRGLLFAPVALLLGRNMYLYGADSFLYGVLCAICSVGIFTQAPRLIADRSNAALLQATAILPAFGAQLFFIVALGFGLDPVFSIPVVAFPLVMVLIAMSLSCVGSGELYRKSASLLAISATILQLCNFPGLASSAMSVFVGVIATSYGYTVQQKSSFFLGIIGLVVGLGYHLHFAIDIVTFAPWMSLAIAGTLTVLASSYIERYAQHMLTIASQMRAQLAQWK